MFNTIPRRKRLVWITASAAGLFVLASAGAVWWATRPDRVYRPGEEIEGLTRDLERSLPDDHPPVTFRDVAAAAGVEFRHFHGTRTSQLPEDMGSGAAWGDYDNDGWIDLYVANLAGPLTLSEEGVAASPAHSALFHNDGDGGFTEVSARAGVDFRGMAMGAAWGDYDADGWRDLFVSAYGENRLYRNEGDGTFRDVTRRAGIAGHVGYWSGATWADYDRDGDLDLYVGGYVRYSPTAGGPTSRQYDVEVPASLNPSSFRPERNLLFRNRGDGTFEEVAAEAGVEGREGRSLGAAWADFDEDGWLDLYVANDVSDNALYRNLGDGTFRDVSHAALVADYRGAMGLAVGDWDGDEDVDLFVTHWIAQENALFSSLRSRLEASERPPSSGLQFMDEADRHGLGQVALDYIGWGTSFFDYDNDGLLDLLVVNGSTFQEPERPERLVAMADQLFWNRGPEEGFYDVSSVSGDHFGRELVGRGAAFGDYDNDGDVDVFIVNHGAPAALLRNEGGNRNAWLQVRLEPGNGAPDPVGARVRVVADGRVRTGYVGAQSSYLSQNALRQHFGLGEARRVDTLAVIWPDGDAQRFTDLETGQAVVVRRGAERVARDPRFPTGLVSAIRGGERAAGGGVPAEGEDDREARDAVLRFWQLYRRATRHRIEGRAEEAAVTYEAALEIDPDHQNTLYWLGNVRFGLGELESAVETWERLRDLNPADARVHRMLGVAHSCVGRLGLFDPERAHQAFSRALEINKEETGSLLWLAQVALLRGDLGAARDYLETTLRTNPRSATGHYLVGYLEWKAERWRDARDRFGRAVEMARPLQTADPGLSEGDTESGRAMLAETSGCRTPGDGAEALVELADSEPDPPQLDAAMERSYAALDRLLQEAGRAGDA